MMPGRATDADQANFAGARRVTVERTLLWLMVAASAVNYFDRSILSIAAPSIIRELGISETAMGAIFSAFLISYTALMTPAGWLADRLGGQKVIAFAAFGWGIFTIATPMAAWIGLAGSIAFAWMLVARFLLGATSAPLYPCCANLTADFIPPEIAARTQSLVLSASALGSAVAPLVFSALIRSLGWQVAFVIAGGATCALAVLWVKMTRPYRASNRPVAASTRGGSPLLLLKNRKLLILSASYFCLNYFEYIFFYWTYYYFGEVLHVPQSLTAVATTCIMLGMVVLGPAGGWLSDRLALTQGLQRSRRKIVICVLTLSALLLCAGASGFGITTTIVLLTLAFGFASMSEGPFWASAISVAENDAGAAGGLMNTIGNVGGILAPVLTPLIASHFGWQTAMWAGAGVLLAGMSAWFLMPVSDPPPSSTYY
jgi:MFS family permease